MHNQPAPQWIDQDCCSHDSQLAHLILPQEQSHAHKPQRCLLFRQHFDRDGCSADFDGSTELGDYAIGSLYDLAPVTKEHLWQSCTKQLSMM